VENEGGFINWILLGELSVGDQLSGIGTFQTLSREASLVSSGINVA